MTLHRIHNIIQFECDECREELDTETTDFSEAKQRLEEEGWIAVKNSNDEWEHICKGCQ